MTHILGLQGEMPSVSSLQPYANNPRTHANKQVRQIARSIERFGWTNPVLIDGDGCVIAGHGRLEAAKLLGMAEVPVRCLTHMSEAEKRAYIIADNKLAENAGWDNDLLALELQGLLDLDMGFDLELTGFDFGEIDIILGDGFKVAEETAPEPEREDPAINQNGDMWFIGPHRLICGDCLEHKIWTKLLGSDKGQMVFTDPPYNVRVDGHVSGLGRNKHREFAMASGEMTSTEFTSFLRETFLQLSEFSEDGASGQQLLQMLRREQPKGVPRPIARKPEGDKVTRFAAQSHRIEAGELVLPEQATWLDDIERELLGFPNLRHDDQVDALTQLLA